MLVTKYWHSELKVVNYFVLPVEFMMITNTTPPHSVLSAVLPTDIRTLQQATTTVATATRNPTQTRQRDLRASVAIPVVAIQLSSVEEIQDIHFSITLQ